MSASVHLGTWDGDRSPGYLDLDIILRSNLLIQAASGGGKSWAIRRIVEQAFKHVPIIIIDPEGEFGSLREKYDFVLAGPGGDTPVDVRSAALLARKVLELRTSIICDTFELPKRQKPIWAKAFLDALIEAPKNLWSDFLIIVDEAHELCPESGRGAKNECVASDSVVDLCAKGRKRGYGAVLATQRLGKLRKDAAAECKNVIIGQTFIDIDRDRAADSLGILRATRETFFNIVKMLKPGEFYGLGRGISIEPRRLQVGGVVTTHPEPGSKRTVKLPPPTTKILHLLPQLKDLPAEAEKKAKTEAELHAEIRGLKAELARKPSTKTVEAAKPFVPKEVRVLQKSVKTRIIRFLDLLDKERVQQDRMQKIVAECVPAIYGDFEALEKVNSNPSESAQPVFTRQTPVYRSVEELARAHGIPVRAAANGDAKIGKGERIVLVAVAQHESGVSREQLSVLTGYKRSSRDAYLQRLRVAGYIDQQGETIVATEAGIAFLGSDFAPLPTGDALRDHWMQRLPEGERRVLKVVVEAYPESVIREAIDEVTGYKRSSRDAYLQRLSSRKLIMIEHGFIQASTTLFDR